MPTNKNAMTRYALIDNILANRHRAYSIQDITDIINEKLVDYDQDPVSKRCIEKDITYLQSESPFLADIEEYWVDASDRNGRPYRKRCVRYSDPTFSIFKQKLTDDEKAILSAALETLGSFEGLENFEWLSDLKQRLNLEEHNTIISISKNLLSNSTLLARLFLTIKSKSVITLYYHTFANSEIRTTDIIPRLLKEYNNRWFLISTACDSDRVLTFPLDRINDFVINYTIPYKTNLLDLEERYEDIIGVTYVEGALVEEIVFWVSDTSKEYIKTKPIHGSQIHFSKERESEMRKLYPSLIGGEFFSIKCKRNYELIRELCSYGQDLIVVYPKEIAKDILSRVNSMNERYSTLMD